MEVMSELLAVINTDAYKLTQSLNKKFETICINDVNTCIPDREDIRYVFTSYQSLAKNIKNLKYPPILCENPSTVRLISISYPVLLLDAKLHDNGLITFNSIDRKLIKYLNTEFKYSGPIIFAKSEVVQYGNHSELAISLNNFLLTTPSFTHSAFLIAFTKHLENIEDKSYKTFIEDNRLVSDENTKEYKALMAVVAKISQYLPLLLNKDKKLNALKDKSIKLNLSRTRFLFNNYGTRNLQSYLDKEANINTRSKILQDKRAGIK